MAGFVTSLLSHCPGTLSSLGRSPAPSHAIPGLALGCAYLPSLIVPRPLLSGFEFLIHASPPVILCIHTEGLLAEETASAKALR